MCWYRQVDLVHHRFAKRRQANATLQPGLLQNKSEKGFVPSLWLALVTAGRPQVLQRKPLLF